MNILKQTVIDKNVDIAIIAEPNKYQLWRKKVDQARGMV